MCIKLNLIESISSLETKDFDFETRLSAISTKDWVAGKIQGINFENQLNLSLNFKISYCTIKTEQQYLKAKN
jgi:hypothetical protein